MLNMNAPLWNFFHWHMVLVGYLTWISTGCGTIDEPIPKTENNRVEPAPIQTNPPPLKESPPTPKDSPPTPKGSEPTKEPVANGDTDKNPNRVAVATPNYPWPYKPSGQPIIDRFVPPDGFNRVYAKEGSFGHWLQHLPVMPGKPPVLLHNGELKGNQSAHVAVIDIDVGKRDLQQCADATIRLWGEYQRSIDKNANICFRAANGTKAKWRKWRDGYRPSKTNPKKWEQSSRPSSNYPTFRKYLDKVFGIANSASIIHQMEVVDDPTDIQLGDVYLVPANSQRYGHAVMVVDMVQNPSGEKRFLLVQSYMPAQNIQVLKNPQNPNSPWYEAPKDGSIITPEWTFGPGSLRRYTPGKC